MAEHVHHHPRTDRRDATRLTLLPVVLALISGATGLTLALHYPLAPAVMTALVLAGWGAFFAWPQLWLLLVPALLPLIGLAPWTGWITFEELDILILAVAAGGYARLAWPASANKAVDGGARDAAAGMAGVSVLAWLLALLFALSTLVAVGRGFADAGGFSFGWFQGYLEPMNSVRLGKSILLALLVLPLWQSAVREQPERTQRLLAWGLMLGLAGASLATVWERTAFTGLLNFSSDYRTTGLFWEMHVGGAALDGFLALTVPFALRELMLARTPTRWGLAAAVLALGAYACLTTFSRGVYLAVPIGLTVFLGLHARQIKLLAPAPGSGAMPTSQSDNGMHLGTTLWLMVGFGVGAAWMFQTSGYRGMAALLGTVALMLPLAQVLRRFKANQWLAGMALGLVLMLLAGAIGWLLPKGAYVAWGLAAGLTVVMLWLGRHATPAAVMAGPMAFGGFLATVAAGALVANHWGETAGLRHAAPALLAMLTVSVVAGVRRKPLWPQALRWQATTACTLALVAAVVGVMDGGAYMSDRFSTGEGDLNVRLAHWRLGRDMLRTPADWWLGKGMGRFPANYFLLGDPEQHPGDYRLKREDGSTFLTLTGGLHVLGWGEMFRVSQRVEPPGSSALVTARVRADKDVQLHFEVCEKHLLYNAGCILAEPSVKGMPGVWQDLRVPLKGGAVTRGDWYAPRLLAFSMAMATQGGVANLADLALTSADGRELLTNGDFSAGMAHWFFSSDRYHMPWHIKSLYMDVLFDQGLVGLALWSLLLAGALWRTSLGGARRQPLAPALAASLSGFAVVGLFDSLVDVPRVAWLFYLLVLVAWTLPRQPQAHVQARPRRPGAVAGLTAIALFCLVIALPGSARAGAAEPAPQVIHVGASETIKTIADAARLARAGATIDVDSGTYAGDVAVWTQDNLTLRAVGGRVRLLARGAAAEGKGIWVVRAHGMRVDGFDFEGAAVPDHNGAGIRLESGSLQVRNCRFMYNEMGLLTNNDPATVLDIDNSEFAYNQRPDGHNHNLYVGQIARLSVTGSYFHHAHIGHLLKSRAAVSRIVNNRLIDGAGGTASYELEFPNGGMAYVAGNTIAQSAGTENPVLISFGAEGYKWPRNEIDLENNTLVNPLPLGGVFLKVAPGADAIRAVNNRLAGIGTLESAGRGEYRDNTRIDLHDAII
ncbi:hypothetical protein [Polaromonas sp. C04]|uniref:hypothetical protein n=1 Tax=Polaromonas sp. C04 TaxID=1945857 RepID=UPI0009840CF8|nr:hypothetical protein [Polaromonas sp. C04]OOG51175.1 hypothetical protein B0E49_16250 [Polaromonas sp. C04]